jgi:LacI family transcriptional regulator
VYQYRYRKDMTATDRAINSLPEKGKERSVTTARRPNMRQVAELAGVAMSSVSRVLSGHPDVSPAMRERVLQAVHELGYEPDFLAQSLRRGATRSIGFAISDISNPVIAEIALGAEEVLRRAGYAMVVMNSENDPALDAAHIRFLQSRRVDGMIITVASERKRATIDALAQVEVPVVVIDRDLPKRVHASAVLVEHRKGMAAAAGHLLDLGHRRIGLLSWPLELRPGRERLAGLRQAYAERGLPDTSITITGLLTPEQARAATEQLLDEVEPPTALIAGANQLLIGCLRALITRGLRPGTDLALLTCDDIPLAELYNPPLAVIARDNVGTGRAAAELLLHRLNGSEEPETVTLSTTFIPRASCTPPGR